MKQTRSLLLGLAVFSVVALVVFGPALFSDKSIFTGDAPGFSHPDWSFEELTAHYVGNWGRGNSSLGTGYGATALNPLRLFRDFAIWTDNPLSWTFLLSALLVFLGTLYYARGLGLPLDAGLAPALGLAFAGYSFTLISAGHVGFSQLMAYVLFLFGALDRAVRKGALFHYGLTGTLVLWGIGVQPDMMIPFSILAAVYALVLLFTGRDWTHGNRKASILRAGKGVFVAVAFALVFGLGSFRFLFETIIPQRDAESSNPLESHWSFMTNWSFPPGESWEFICPNLYGIETANPEAPYWGALGRRPEQWEALFSEALSQYRQAGSEEERQRAGQELQSLIGARNLRQHSVYLGIAPICFALFAVWGLRRRERGDPLRPVIWFWLVAAVVCLLFAYGRHAPFYKLPYAIPYLNKIRAPVKYLRVVEIALAFLFTIGLSQLLLELKKVPAAARRYRNWMIGCALIGFGFLAAFLIRLSPSAALSAEWERLFFNGMEDRFLAQMRSALLHSFFVFNALALLFALLWKRGGDSRVARLFPYALLCLVAIDVAIVTRPFVHVRDKSVFYAPNSMADLIAADTTGAHTDILLMPFNQLNPSAYNWVHHGVLFLRPAQAKYLNPRTRLWFDALGRDPVRLWSLTGSRFVVGQRSMLDPLVRAGLLKERRRFFIEKTGTYRSALTDPKAPFALYELTKPVPPALVHHHATVLPDGADDAAVMAEVEALSLPPVSVVLEEAPGFSLAEQAVPPTAAEILSDTGNRMVIQASTAKPGVLVVNQSWHRDLQVKLNGESAKLLRCNFLLRGVALPAGEHRVEFLYRPYRIPLVLNLVATGTLLIWGGYRWVRARSREE